ncbi:MAG: CCA tRNA nucleotidyltransferase [Bacilli bacterium]
MKEKALEVLKILYEHGYESYVVGGYVRDIILKRKTNDIDICTSATPKEILEIFDNVIVSDMQYGSVVIAYKGYKFDTTTFRKEIKYEDNRKPVKIKYIKDIKKDLLRRDFTINTLCIDKDGNILDILNIRSDIDNKLLKTVGNPRYRIKEDSLRILRCIRFATILDFNIENKTKHFLTKYSYLLKNLSINRKKEELDKIFLSKNKERGRKLLLELNLTNALDLDKLATITMCTDLTGIWCQLEVDNIYPFTKVEKEQMTKLRELLKYDKIDNYLLYKYGLYLCTVYAEIKGISRKKLSTMYSNLPILTRKDINITGEEISMILNKTPGKYIKDILDDIELNILNNNINNDKEEITKYIKDKYL